MTDDPLRRAALALLEACDRTGQEPFPQQMQMLREALSTPVSAGRAADVAEKLKRAHGECILKLGYLAQVPDYASGHPAAKRAWEQAEATFDTALAALAPTPQAADVERVADNIVRVVRDGDGELYDMTYGEAVEFVATAIHALRAPVAPIIPDARKSVHGEPLPDTGFNAPVAPARSDDVEALKAQNARLLNANASK